MRFIDRLLSFTGRGKSAGRPDRKGHGSGYGPHRWFVNGWFAKAGRAALPALVFLFAASAALADERPLKLLVLGDSLTAGYGLAADRSFPAQLEAALRAKGVVVEVINAGVSGDTTAGGRARLDWALGDRPDAVILELGANDALRGLPPARVEENLAAILARLAEAKLPVLLAGMRAPRNNGPDYAAEFDAVYPDLARRFGVPLYPFFLEGVATEADLNQGDGIHPNAKGVAAIVERILPYVMTLLESAKPKA